MMENELIKFIEKQGSIFSAAKYFGGMEKLKELGKDNPELLELINHSTKGYLTFKSDNGKKHTFEFYVKQFDVDDLMDEHLYIIVDLIIHKNKNNLETIGIWVDSYCEDGRPEYHFNDSTLSQYTYVMGRVDSVNGVKIPDGSRLEDEDSLIPDEEAQKLLKENLNKKKYLITESQLDELITKQLYIIFDVDNIHSTNPYEHDEDTGEEYEDPNRLEFYHGDYGDEETVFYWYDKEYWGKDSESYTGYKSKSPILDIEEPYRSNLNGLFGNKWYKPFKVWFKHNFEVPVKSVMDEVFDK